MSTDIKPEVLIRRILDEVSKIIVGKRVVLKRVLSAILADGHVLFHDVPGLAKTMMARAFAMVMGIEFNQSIDEKS